MESTSRRTEEIIGIARLLEEHRGEETMVLDLRNMSSWTDYFVITTARSGAHLGGLVRSLYDYLGEHGRGVLRHHPRARPRPGRRRCQLTFRHSRVAPQAHRDHRPEG